MRNNSSISCDGLFALTYLSKEAKNDREHHHVPRYRTDVLTLHLCTVLYLYNKIDILYMTSSDVCWVKHHDIETLQYCSTSIASLLLLLVRVE